MLLVNTSSTLIVTNDTKGIRLKFLGNAQGKFSIKRKNTIAATQVKGIKVKLSTNIQTNVELN